MYIGVDFGTSFSQVATNVLNSPVLLLAPGEYGVPSTFFYSQAYGTLVGDEANEAGVGDDAVNLVKEVKMHLTASFVLDGKTFEAKEIIKEIFKHIISRAVDIAEKKNVNSDIEGIVISVPAKFGMQPRTIIRDAARTCVPGKTLHISDIIKEPVAAALAYYKSDAENEKNILVYDLGGGTCDIALVRADDSLQEHYEVVDSDMEILGGRDWDRRLYDYLVSELKKKNIEPRGNFGLQEKIKRAANKVKHDLSDEFKNTVRARIDVNGRIEMIAVTRDKFDSLTEDLLDKSIECLKRVYNRNKDCVIDDIILVGGSSNMLQVREGIIKAFPDCNVKIYEPELAVVSGTSVYADLIKSSKISSVLQDKCNFSYGIRAYSNVNDRYEIVNIILKNENLPYKGTHCFAPRRDYQEEVSFKVFESDFTEETFDFDNPNKKQVGEVTLLLPYGTMSTERLDCTMILNSQGLLDVSATGPGNSYIHAEFKLNE